MHLIQFLIFWGCTDKEEQDTATSTSDTSEASSSEVIEDDTAVGEAEEEMETYILQDGTWAYSNVEIEVEDCNLSDNARQSTIQSILDVRYNVQYVASNNYLFTLLLDENTEVEFVCIVEENQLTCEDLVLEIPAYDSIVFETYRSVGVLGSATRVQGQINKSHTCEGDDCDAIEIAVGVSFPCDIEFSYTFNFFD